MKRIVVSALLVLFVLLVGGGFWVWNAMQQPLYTPGSLRAGADLRAPLDPPAQPGNKDYWTVEPDIRLYHFASGTGANVLVVHGGPGYPFGAPIPGLASLTDRYAFQYYDQRGCGKSSRPIDAFSSSNYWENMQTLDRTLGLGAQIADIERVRRILGDDKVILIGHSWGGFLASLYAAEFPAHVKALVLVAPAQALVMPAEDGGLFDEVKALLPAETQADYDAYLKRYLDYGSIFSKNEAGLAAMNAEFARYYAAAASRKGFAVAEESNTAAGGGWMVHAMYMSMGMRHDYRSALKSVTAPALVVHGANDIQTQAASRAYADLIPNARFSVLDNAGHFVFDDQPAAFAKLVGDFLDGVK